MNLMTPRFFKLPVGSGLSLRDQICEVVSSAITSQALAHDRPLPSCRELANQLNVSRNTVFAAYNVYVIDAKTYRILGKASGNLQKRAHGIDIAWHKGYGGVSGNTLKAVRDVLRKNLPASVASVVRKTGLP